MVQIPNTHFSYSIFVFFLNNNKPLLYILDCYRILWEQKVSLLK